MAIIRTPRLDEEADVVSANSFEAASVSQRGSYHERNEDRALYTKHFFGIADGVGGGANGDIAAQTLIDYCANIPHWQDAHLLQQALIQSDAVVQTALQQHDSAQGASTLAAAWLNEQGQGFISWVGDVRLYHLQHHAQQIQVTQLSIDQSYDYLGEISPSGQQDAPARMVGSGAVGVPPIQAIQLQQHEALLILSDGVYRFLEDNQLATTCQQLLHHPSLNSICQQLVELAIEQGSYDDATALMVRLKPSFVVPSASNTATQLQATPRKNQRKWLIHSANVAILLIVLLLAIALGFYWGQQGAICFG